MIKAGEDFKSNLLTQTFAVLLFVLISGCSGNAVQNRKTATLASGKTVEIFFEKEVSPEKVPVLVVDYKTEELILREDAVDSEVLEIWENVKNEADKRDLDEGIIRYRFFNGENSNDGRPVYTGMLFTAERMENGKWKIDKIF